MTAYLNGKFMPIAEARISPLDRGFLFADGAYEVIPVYGRYGFRQEEHMRRFQVSLDGIRLPNPHTPDEWRALIKQIIANAPFEDQQLYIQVTRGADVKRDAAFPVNVPQTVFMFTAPMAKPTVEMRANGVACVTAPDIRWGRCDLKTVALLANSQARQISVDAGCTETIMIRDGFLTEGSASNVFIVKNGVVLAPPKNNRILPGITYDVVFELAAKHGVPNEARPITEAEVLDADEIWVTSSTKEILPVTKLNGKLVGHGDAAGKVGPVAQKLHKAYVDFRDALVAASKNA